MHVAIIMDGNGRWAAARGEPRVAGHREGARRIREVVEAAPALGVEVLSLYAFSADNWKRPEAEVAALMSIFMRHLSDEERRLVTSGVRLSLLSSTWLAMWSSQVRALLWSSGSFSMPR